MVLLPFTRDVSILNLKLRKKCKREEFDEDFSKLK